MRRDLGETNSLTHGNRSILTRLSEMLSGYFCFDEGSFRTANLLHRDVISQLKILLDLTRRIWRSHIQIENWMAHLNASAPSPDLRLTWFQEPVRFEDAMGRVIPIPSEYDWGVSLPCLIYCCHSLLIFSLNRNLKLLLWPNSKMDLCKRKYALANTNSLTHWTAHRSFPGPRARYLHPG